MSESPKTHDRKRRRRRRTSFSGKDLVALVWMVAMFWGMMYGIRQIQNDVRETGRLVMKVQERFSRNDPNWNIQEQFEKLEKNTLGIQSDLARVKVKVDSLTSGSVLEIN